MSCQPRCPTEHVAGDLGESKPGTDVAEHLIRFRSARRRVVAAVREEQFRASIAVEIGDVDLVGPEFRFPDRGGSHVVPERAGRACLRRTFSADERGERDRGQHDREERSAGWMARHARILPVVPHCAADD
jgi:hypothetical protein